MGFNYKTQLYTKTTNSYKLITYFNNNEDTIMGVFEPLSQNGYKCFGQILVSARIPIQLIHQLLKVHVHILLISNSFILQIIASLYGK